MKGSMRMEEYYAGDLVGASEYFIKAIEKDESNFYAHYNLG